MHSQPTIKYALLSPRIGKYHLQNLNQTLTLCLETRPEGTSKGTCESICDTRCDTAISTKSQQQKRLRVDTAFGNDLA